jgi:hypothetical protein
LSPEESEPETGDPDSYDVWLDSGLMNVAAASDLLKPNDALLMRCCPVSTKINHVANDNDEFSATVKFAGVTLYTLRQLGKAMVYSIATPRQAGCFAMRSKRRAIPRGKESLGRCGMPSHVWPKLPTAPMTRFCISAKPSIAIIEMPMP